MKKLNNKKSFIINEQIATAIPNVRTYQRGSIILPNFVGKSIQVHNGKIFTKINIIKEMIGHRLGEFVKTRKTFKFKKKTK